MTLKLLKCLDGDGEVLRAASVDALYVDGYGFGERSLEGVPFRITLADGELKAEMLLDEKLRKSMRIDREEAEADAASYALSMDIFHLEEKLQGEEDGLILRTDLPPSGQTFNCPPCLEVDGVIIELPPEPEAPGFG